MSRYASPTSKRYLWHLQQVRRRKRARREEVFPLAVGGTETVINPEPNVFYRVHSFTDVGESSLEVLRGGEVEYLVVAGGGGGGRFAAGGGGAGGLLFGSKNVFTGSIQTIVGSGGTGLASGTGQGENGENSLFGDFEAIGGGAGGGGRDTDDPEILKGKSGGSGGGSGSPETAVFGFGIAGQGNDGGAGSGSAQGGGGGGGAGQKGQDGPSTSKGGDGGDGLDFSDKFGANVGDEGFFAGGGGGTTLDTQGFGGKGGGGDGFPNVQNGQPNTGGGGGGQGGNGGSGIVIVRYQISEADFIESGGVIA